MSATPSGSTMVAIAPSPSVSAGRAGTRLFFRPIKCSCAAPADEPQARGWVGWAGALGKESMRELAACRCLHADAAACALAMHTPYVPIPLRRRHHPWRARPWRQPAFCSGASRWVLRLREVAGTFAAVRACMWGAAALAHRTSLGHLRPALHECLPTGLRQTRGTHACAQ